MRLKCNKTAFLFSLMLSVASSLTAQGIFEGRFNQDVEENKLKLEIEPGLFFNNGRSINGLYSVSENNNFAVGLYLMATDVPEQIHKNMFNNVMDSSHVRATQEYAINLRYRLRVFKKFESNPYVGLILGWEELRLTNDKLQDLEITTMLVTPHLGYEVYLYKRMIYLNTQIRSVFYMGGKKSDTTRPESLKSYLILPSISFGLRI